MQIRTQSRVAIAAILDVAVHGADRPVSLADISERQGVSESYLEQLFKKLRRKGFVASYRGRGGGYRLNGDLATIFVADIIAAVDREIFDCGSGNGTGSSPGPRACVTTGLWSRVNDHLYDYLRTVTLESVLADTGKVVEARETMAVAAAVPRVERGLPRHKDRSVAAVA